MLYPLDEVLLLVLPGVTAGCESWVETARYGEKKLPLLRRFRPFKNEPSSHDQLGNIFAVLDAEQFQACFVAWVTSLAKAGKLSGDQVLIAKLGFAFVSGFAMGASYSPSGSRIVTLSILKLAQTHISTTGTSRSISTS